MPKCFLEGWQRDFICLAYPLFPTSLISEIIGYDGAYIRNFAKDKNIKKAKSVYPGDIFIETKSGPLRKWKCHCKCGNYTYVTSASLYSGKTKSCGCYHKERISNGTKFISGTFFGKIRTSARDRGITFDLTIEELEEVLIKQDFKCALTKLPLLLKLDNLADTIIKHNCSVDRIDNTKGYTKDNIQILHMNVNIMKSTFTQSHFIFLCHLIAQNTEFVPNETVALEYKKEPNFSWSYRRSQLLENRNNNSEF